MGQWISKYNSITPSSILDEKNKIDIFDELLTFKAWIRPMVFFYNKHHKKLHVNCSCEHKCFSPSDHLVHPKNPYSKKTFTLN